MEHGLVATGGRRGRAVWGQNWSRPAPFPPPKGTLGQLTPSLLQQLFPLPGWDLHSLPSAGLVPAGFRSFPLSRSAPILLHLIGASLFLYRMKPLLMPFFRVTKAVSALSPLQCQDSPQVSLCPLQLLISIQIPDNQGLLPYGFLVLFHTVHWLHIHFRGEGANSSKCSRMP